MEDVEIEPLQSYDFRRARLSVALKWILNAAFGANIPASLSEPLPLKDRDTVAAIYVNTGLVSLLINSKLYTHACLNLFPHLSSTWKQGSGHWSVIQGLSRLGVYVEDDNGQVITEAELVQTNPFHLTAHVTLIEALMTAYTQSLATTQKTVQAVKAVGPFNASEDLPIDYEDALLMWMNKVCSACMKHESRKLAAASSGKGQQSHPADTSVQLMEGLLMEELLKDISDGRSLSMLISFYCPKQLKFSDIHTRDPIGIADSLHNLWLARVFCDNHLPVKIFNFTYEDLLYTNETIKPSLLAFLSQLFCYFVVQPLDIVSAPRTSNGSDSGQGVKTIAPPSLAATRSNQSGFTPVSANQHVNGPQDLISDATKKSFQHSPSSSRLSNHSDFGSNPSLNTSGKLLHKRSTQVTESSGMHDTVSPIVVRKSQSMGILNPADPKQSLVAWESKPYYIDRSANHPHRVSNGSTSLLSNVSFSEDADEEETGATNSVASSTSDVKRRPLATRSTERPKSTCNMNYQQLLDRSSDLESPLKLFAQKHGFQLTEKSSPRDTAGGDHSKSPSPADITSTDLTKVTPRSESNRSPTLHASSEQRNGSLATGQSYVISSALTPECAAAAGLPIIADELVDSCTEVTFASLADNEDTLKSAESSPRLAGDASTSLHLLANQTTPDGSELGLHRNRSVSQSERAESPIQPIELYGDSEMTSFAGMGVAKTGNTHQQPSDLSSAPPTNLKYRFEQQKGSAPQEAKASKKTTFSLNHTTWSEQAKSKTSQPDADPQPEHHESGGDRKPFADVKILLEEKRKAMERKKTLEDMERAKEVDKTSRQAFLKAVARKKGQAEQNNNQSFSRNDISKSIESLQNKWQRDEISSAKRASATTAAKSINVTAAPLDNITEVTESMEAKTPTVPLPSARTVAEPEMDREERRRSSTDMHEAPVDVEQYGLEELNASLSELKGEMKRLSDEQKRIDDLQRVMRSRPQSMSTPNDKSPCVGDSPQPSTIHSDQLQLSQPVKPLAAPDQSHKWTHVTADVTAPVFTPDTPAQVLANSRSNALTSSCPASRGPTSSCPAEEEFSRPSSHSMTQSTDEPFILHDVRSSSPLAKTVNKSADKNRNKLPSGKDSTKHSSSDAQRRSSNGFLSSSQLSRKKATEKPETTPVPIPTASDSSVGRKRWSADNPPLFPGYDDKPAEKAALPVREPAVPAAHPIFQPPHDVPPQTRVPQKSKKSSQKLQLGSPEDTPVREVRQRIASDTMEIRQLPGHQLPLNLSMSDTPAREVRGGSSSGFSMPLKTSNDQQPLTNVFDETIDTPMRPGYQFPASHDISKDSTASADISGLAPLEPTPELDQSLAVSVSSRPGSHFAHNNSIDTPMRQPFHPNHPKQFTSYDDILDTPMRRPTPTELTSTPTQRHQRPHSMIESGLSGLHDATVDTPMREALRRSQIFYSPPTRDAATVPEELVERDSSTHPVHSSEQRPLAVSRHGTSTIAPHTTSRHGTVHTDHPLGSPNNSSMLVRAPYEFAPRTESVPKTQQSPYKLNTPYGNAENEIKPVETNISLSSAMDAIRNDMRKQHGTDPIPNTNLSFSPPNGASYSQQSSGLEQPLSNQASTTNLGQGQSRNVSSGLSDLENSLADLSSTHAPGPTATQPAQDVTQMRASSSENDDKVSVHSFGSGSMESGEGTPRVSGSKPKRATWDMTTPRGDLLNQPGVGFIVAEQAQLSEEELRKRKEKVMMMQLKRRENQELKKQQKLAELAAKSEAARIKEQEAERKKLEEKAKKEAILQQFQTRKQEEDLPPELRANFRQKQKRHERPASIHWAGSSADENSLRASDHLDSATSFTVSLNSGSLTHRRPISPAASSAAGSLSSRSKASSRGIIEAPPDEYTGPKLYVKPSSKQKSNRTIIINAVSHCCLAGVVNTDNKNKVLEEIARSDGKHFLILFRDGNQTYKAVYSYEPDSEECTKIHGQGPKYIKDDMCHRFYKYNSGGKKFTEVLSTKHLSVSIDAITIHNHLWQKKTVSVSSRR